MKAVFLLSLLLTFAPSFAQHYYKDIVGTNESTKLIAGYRKNNVQDVTLKSYTVNDVPIEGLLVAQTFSLSTQTLRTATKTAYLPASYLITYFDANDRVLKTTDSTEGGAVNTTVYRYNNEGRLISVFTTFGDSMATLRTEEHQWQWNALGQAARMLRIRNGSDSSVVNFKHDESGNVTEEQETVRFVREEPIYYFWDTKNRLTDIVRYNKKAARLLPDQMFEYASNNQLVQRTTVPQNSDDYLVWRYHFGNNGLKQSEEIFNKQKELTGKVEYLYSFAK